MTGGRQLALSKRDNFFNDPFFADILSIEDSALKGRLDLFKQHQLVGAGSGPDQAHNLQVTASNDKFVIQLELPGFAPEEFSLKTRDDFIILEAKHSGKADGEVTERNYSKEFKMPSGVNPEQLASSYSAAGILTIQAPRKLTAPEGAQVSEAMAANSKAYSSEDGKTKVKEQAQSSEQMIAATTESPDGSTKSSMSFSSSSSSSSSMMTSSSGDGPIPSLDMSMPGMPPMRGMPSMPGMPPMPSLSMGGDPGADMDAMMAKMMGGMGMSSSSTGMSSSSTMSSSTSMSSSSSSSSTMQSSALGGFGGPALNIEELSTAGTDVTGPPSYTVTSPPASVAGDDDVGKGFPAQTSHSVKPTADYKKVEDPQADCTVLLKLRQGDEYKLVLNMQQYAPENISVKLGEDERTLTVTAAEKAAGKEDFVQRHTIPEGVDVDKLESSFSADGVLVIKAPRKK